MMDKAYPLQPQVIAWLPLPLPMGKAQRYSTWYYTFHNFPLNNVRPCIQMYYSILQ